MDQVKAIPEKKIILETELINGRKANITTPIIVGGPYPTASHVEVLEDKNIDLAVIAEGEITFSEILDEMIKNNKKFPSKEVLATIDGIAFRKN